MQQMKKVGVDPQSIDNIDKRHIVEFDAERHGISRLSNMNSFRSTSSTPLPSKNGRECIKQDIILMQVT